MPEHSTDPDNAPSWADLIDIDSMDKGPPVWSGNDLGAVLRHQLSAPIQFDLSNLDAQAVANLQQSPQAGRLLVSTFGQLLHEADPNPELLDLTRRFAKSAMNDQNGPLPREVALVLYYACILVALIHCGRRITRLDNDALARGVRSVLEWQWLDLRTREVLQRGLDDLAAKPG